MCCIVDKLELNTTIDTFDAHGLRAQNDKVIDIPDMITVLRSLYEVVQAAHPGEIRLPLAIDLCLNWILNVYDRCISSLQISKFIVHHHILQSTIIGSLQPTVG